MVWLWQNSKCRWHISGPKIRDTYLLASGKVTLSLTDTKAGPGRILENPVVNTTTAEEEDAKMNKIYSHKNCTQIVHSGKCLFSLYYLFQIYPLLCISSAVLFSPSLSNDRSIQWLLNVHVHIHTCTGSPFPLHISAHSSLVSPDEHSANFLRFALGPGLLYALSIEAAFTAPSLFLCLNQVEPTAHSWLGKLVHPKRLLLTFACIVSLWPGLGCSFMNDTQPLHATRGKPQAASQTNALVSSLIPSPAGVIWTSASICCFYEHRAGLLYKKSSINLLISSFSSKPIVESEIRFKINMEALKVILVWAI